MCNPACFGQTRSTRAAKSQPVQVQVPQNAQSKRQSVPTEQDEAIRIAVQKQQKADAVKSSIQRAASSKQTRNRIAR